MEETQSTKPYNHHEVIEAAATPVSRAILKLLAENADELINDVTIVRTPEEKKVWNEKCTDIAINVVTLISEETSLPYEYATLPIEKIDTVLTILKNYVNGRVNQSEDELISRTLGVKSPEGKFRKQHASLGGLLVQLDTVRQSQGNNGDDYFVPPKPAPEPTSVENPAQEGQTAPEVQPEAPAPDLSTGTPAAE